MSTDNNLSTFVKGKTLKNMASGDNAKLVFLVKSNMKIIPAFKMILKRIKFVKKSNRNIKKSYVIKGMGKNIQTTLKLATMLMEELEEEIKENMKIYIRQVTVYNKLITKLEESKDVIDFSGDEEETAEVKTEVIAKTVPGVEIHIPLESMYL
ncbi:hypothetical protein QEN19_002024 [Hanseniaspora menglaensis]